MIAAMAAAAKARKRKGQSFECLASRRAGRYALSFHLVFKDGSAKKRSQFQITCDHHPPEVLLNKAGKPYKLACRKTLGVYGDGPEDERESHCSKIGQMGSRRAVCALAKGTSRYA